MKRKMRVQKTNGRTGNFGLRVAVVPDDGYWFAQGLDVDYFAAGLTPEEAEKNFEEGLLATAKLNIERSGRYAVKVPPDVVTKPYSDVRYSQIVTHPFDDAPKLLPDFPFSKVIYWVRK